MESSPVIKHEYFGLVKKLNQTNRHKNQETEIYFYIDSTNSNHLKFFAAISATQKILLCQKNDWSNWSESGFSEYPNLERFINRLLRTSDNESNLTNYIKSHIFKLTR